MSTCSSSSEVLGEGYEECNEQFLENTKEHQNIDIHDIKFIDSEESEYGGHEKGITIVFLNSHLLCAQIINWEC